MKKRITIELDSTEDNSKIEHYLKLWIGDNFQKYKDAKITIEDLEKPEEKKDED